MRLFFVGDYRSDTGPSNVNKALKAYLPKKTFYVKTRNIFLRTFEITWKCLRADAVIFSGLSKQNIIGLKVSSIFKKKTIYLMHGCARFENQINGTPSLKQTQLEMKVLELSELILCVSDAFANWLQKQYPQFCGKIGVLTNGIDWDLLERYRCSDLKKDENMIVSIGGGVPIKNIVTICQAVQQANKKYNKKYKLIVIGADGKDTSAIKNFSFAEYKGRLPYAETLRYLQTAKLYIQNSCFETFGLAPIEALLCGCDLLMSKNVGALSILSDIQKTDIIGNIYDEDEICSKIQHVSGYPNNQRILTSINKDATSWAAVAEKLVHLAGG